VTNYVNCAGYQLRILHYVQNYLTLVGGGANFVYGLVNHLRKFGIEQSIVTNKSDDVIKTQYDGLTVFPLTERKFGGYAILDNLVNVLRRHEFDLINIHGYGDYTADMICLLKKTGFLTVPTVLTTHGSSGLVNAYSAISPASSLTPSQRIKRLPHLIYDFTLGRLEITTFDRIIVMSEQEKSYLRHLGLKEQKKVLQIPIAVNDIFFSASCNNAAKKKRENCALYVGRIVEYKGLDTLVKAIKELKVATNIELKCMIIGKDFGYLDELQSLVDKLGITDLVEFMDHVPQNRLIDYYSSALVTVLCSLTEGFPLSLVESMASGTPFIATPVGAIPDLVHQTKAGLIVPVGNAKALANAIRQLVQDRNMWAEMSTRGRENATRFSWDNIAKSYYELYKDLVKEI
jgi:glycosyltransferase involved in cell wall biosynthesis